MFVRLIFVMAWFATITPVTHSGRKRSRSTGVRRGTRHHKTTQYQQPTTSGFSHHNVLPRPAGAPALNSVNCRWVPLEPILLAPVSPLLDLSKLGQFGRASCRERIDL